ncbi:MAG: hypothetical protein [Olavius algarvensis Gamma 1 endosymbiont]|nr:MAG: hypothetical protein [Olavius algarvensis Gamma 1 endosymbiont]
MTPSSRSIIERRTLRDCLKIKLLILSYKFCIFWRFYTVFPRILL